LLEYGRNGRIWLILKLELLRLPMRLLLLLLHLLHPLRLLLLLLPPWLRPFASDSL
jgi:hypothetical protein